jgi:D-3-phosphoglycerate dehydrogenase
MFRVGVTRDIVRADGSFAFDLDAVRENPGIETVLVAAPPELGASDIADLDALVLFRPHVSAATLEGVERLLLIARLGVGVDRVDVEACTGRGILVTTTPDGVRRPMAAGAMAFLLALAHRLPELDRHLRDGGWNRFEQPGTGLMGRTLGIVGLGNIGRDLAGLASPFGLRIVAADPYVSGRIDGVEIVALDELLAIADFVVVAAPLTPETRHLLDARRLALLRPSAYLINIARGPIVDQQALAALLAERRIAGAALDVFEQEPIESSDPLLGLDNVILSPHAVGLTDELLRLSGRSVSESVLAVARGEIPEHVLEPRALERPSTRERLAALAAAAL